LSSIKQFIELLSTGCWNNDEFFGDLCLEDSSMCLTCLDEILSLCEHNYCKAVDEIVKDDVAKSYFAEICELWIVRLFTVKNLTNIKTDKMRKAIDISRKIYNDTSIDLHGYDKDELLRNPFYVVGKDTIVEYIVKKLFSQSYGMKESFSSMVFYFLENYSRESIKEDILELVDLGVLEKDFYKL
jgi:hypothetical protein